MNAPIQAADAGGVAEAGSIAAHLDDLASRIPIAQIDRVWIFPTRRVAGAYSTVIVIAAFEDDGPASEGRRRVLTAHYTARVDRRGRIAVEAALDEHGAASVDRIGRVVEGVLRRLDEELLASPPQEAHIGGNVERWAALRGSSTRE